MPIHNQALIRNTMLSKLVTRCGYWIEWVTSCQYLGVLLISGPRLSAGLITQKQSSIAHSKL